MSKKLCLLTRQTFLMQRSHTRRSVPGKKRSLDLPQRQVPCSVYPGNGCGDLLQDCITWISPLRVLWQEQVPGTCPVVRAQFNYLAPPRHHLTILRLNFDAFSFLCSSSGYAPGIQRCKYKLDVHSIELGPNSRRASSRSSEKFLHKLSTVRHRRQHHTYHRCTCH